MIKAIAAGGVAGGAVAYFIMRKSKGVTLVNYTPAEGINNLFPNGVMTRVGLSMGPTRYPYQILAVQGGRSSVTYSSGNSSL